MMQEPEAPYMLRAVPGERTGRAREVPSRRAVEYLSAGSGDREDTVRDAPVPPMGVDDEVTITGGERPHPGRRAASPSRHKARRAELVARVGEAPLEPGAYAALAELFEETGDGPRAGLMREVSEALSQPIARELSVGDGRAVRSRGGSGSGSTLRGSPGARRAARGAVATEGATARGSLRADDGPAPTLLLSQGELAALQHRALRSPAGELLRLVGAGLTRLFPERRPPADQSPFEAGEGRGATALAEAVLGAVRILGVREVELWLCDETRSRARIGVDASVLPRLVATRELLERPGAPAVLRFEAGAAVLGLAPEYLVLLALRRERLLLGLQVVGEVAHGRLGSAEARLVASTLSARGRARLRELYAPVTSSLDLDTLAIAASQTLDRAGLVIAGAVEPALHALKRRRAAPSELVALMRFAASERYFQLRARVRG